MSRINLEYPYKLEGKKVDSFPFDTTFIYPIPYEVYNYADMHLICAFKNSTTLEYELDENCYKLIDSTDLDEDDVIEDMGYYMRSIENKKGFKLEATGEKVKIKRIE